MGFVATYGCDGDGFCWLWLWWVLWPVVGVVVMGFVGFFFSLSFVVVMGFVPIVGVVVMSFVASYGRCCDEFCGRLGWVVMMGFVGFGCDWFCLDCVFMW